MVTAFEQAWQGGLYTAGFERQKMEHMTVKLGVRQQRIRWFRQFWHYRMLWCFGDGCCACTPCFTGKDCFCFLAFQVVSKRLEVCKLFRTRENDSRIVDTWYISYSSHNPFVRTYAHCLLCRRNCNSIHAFIGSALCISFHSLGAKQNVVETNRQYGKPSYADRCRFGGANDPA